MKPQATTFCHCWRLTRTDATAWGFTDHDCVLDIDGLQYEPHAGFSQSEAEASLGLAVDTSEIEGALASDALSEEDIDKGRLDGAVVETFLVDWTSKTIVQLLRSAVIAAITRRDGAFHAELETRMRHLDRPNGRYLKRQCDAELGDDRCKVALITGVHAASGTVALANGANSFVAADLQDYGEGWFRQGWLTWTSGPSEGERHRVLNHAFDLSGVVLTLGDQRARIETGVTFDILAGCDKHFGTCREKFGNAKNFRGFPHLPGNDAAYAYVTDGLTFDGRALVK